MIQIDTELRTRYAETDQMGVIYYGVYSTYYEVARVEAFRKMNIDYRKMELEDGVMMPVLENKSRYLKSLKYGEVITIRVIVREKPSVKVRYEYEIYNEKKQLVHLGESTLCFMNIKTRRPCRPPQNLMAMVEPYFGGDKHLIIP